MSAAHTLFMLWLVCLLARSTSTETFASAQVTQGRTETRQTLGAGGTIGRAQWRQDTRLRSRRIADENALLGSVEWWRPYLPASAPGAAAHNAELDRQAMSLEGFSTAFSTQPGKVLAFKVDYVFPEAQGSLASAYSFSLRIYRLGYYGGVGARLVATVPLEIGRASHRHARHSYFISNSARYGHSQPECQLKAALFVDCANWSDGAAWAVPAAAVSGIYLAVPHAKPRLANGPHALTGQYIPFVLTNPPGQGSALLVKTSDLTWVAYNKYGGSNLYEPPQNQTAPKPKGFDGRGVIASYNRPWHNRLSFPLGQAHNFLLHTEYPLLHWLEKQSYDVSYASCWDFERTFSPPQSTAAASPTAMAQFMRYRVFISSGHDEYWTARMRQVWAAARGAGVHLAFFSGNEMFWRVGWYSDGKHAESDSDADADAAPRSIFCRKESLGLPQAGPEWNAAEAAEWTGTFTDPRQPAFGEGDANLPPNALTGQVYMVNAYRNDPLEVPSEYFALRFWRHSSLHKLDISSKAGQKVGYRTAAGLLGYEWNAQSNDRFRPAGLVSLSRTWVELRGQLMQSYGAAYAGSGPMRHSLTLYRNQSSGALVFSAGTCQWAWALAPLHDYSWNMHHVPTDANLQQATLNVLADMSVVPWLPSGGMRIPSLLPEEWTANYANANASAPLVAAYPSPDTQAPSSAVTWPQAGVRQTVKSHEAHRPAAPSSVTAPAPAPMQRAQAETAHKESPAGRSTVRIRGTAVDRGGGVIALVEVTADGGVTWGVARGRGRWQFHLTLHFAHQTAVNASVPSIQTHRKGADMATAGGKGLESLALDQDPPVFPEFPTAGAKRMYVTYHLGLPRFNLDVCSSRGQHREWTEIVSLRSRATDDSGWMETESGSSSAKHEVQVLCRCSDR